jgi:class 3 adenylate cyclase/CheY-like chemotaxis protein
VRTTTRTVTVLFTDIVGSTDLMARLGTSAAEGLRARHFSSIRGALAVHRGSEVKTLGDGFMAIFESAGDALGCAVTMQRAVARDNGNREDGGFGMRVGLSAGEVTQEGGDFFGMPVVEASRLCAEATGGQVLISDVVRLLVGWSGMHQIEPLAPIELKGIPQPVGVCEVNWDDEGDSALRVAIAEDAVLLREGIAHVLESEGIEVVLQTNNADALLAGLGATRPHVALMDVRMPPTHTTEGLVAAARIRMDHPEIGVLVLSAEVQPHAARRLLDDGTDGVGYLLKERVGDVGELTAAIRTVASGGSAIDPAVVARLEAVA